VAAAHGFDLKGPVYVATQGFGGVAAAHGFDLKGPVYVATQGLRRVGMDMFQQLR